MPDPDFIGNQIHRFLILLFDFADLSSSSQIAGSLLSEAGRKMI
jgi:hypothetical protein